MVLEAFVTIVHSPTHLTKFSAALPLTRICLLLLGDHPSSKIVCHILNLVGLAMRASSSFARKFELVSGWTIFKVVIPPAWDADVQKLAFDVLMGRNVILDRRSGHQNDSMAVNCPQILPVILTALGTLSISAHLNEQDLTSTTSGESFE